MARACPALLATVWLAGCGTEAIIVSEAAVTDRPDARVVGFTASEDPKLVFSPEDEEVVLKVLFQFNYRAVYEWYKVEWIAPGGVPYKVVSLRTDFASHRDLRADLKIRGKMASRMPGVWRVRIWLLGREGAPDRLLVSRLFRIAEPTPQMLAAGLTPVDVPPGDGDRPLAGTAVADVAAPPPAAAADGAQVLPPLALGAAAAGLAPDATPPPAAGAASGQVAPLPVEGGVAAVSLTATPARAAPPDAARPASRYPGCPPLYYPPGPGCVEQAPQE